MHLTQTLLAVQSDALSRGVAISIAGLLIVFVALLLISLFIATLPRILEQLSKVWPEIDELSPLERHSEDRVAEDAHVLAAIGFVLHTELRRELAAEQASSHRKD